jgi:hypothetical protein
LGGAQADTLQLVNNAAATTFAATQFNSYCIEVLLRGQLSFQYADNRAITVRLCNTTEPTQPNCVGYVTHSRVVRYAF